MSRQEKACTIARPPSSSYQKSPPEGSRELARRGCCRCIATIFSMLSDNTDQLQKPRVKQQVDELKDELSRQRDQKTDYMDRLERMQEYLRYSQDVAKESTATHDQAHTLTFEFEHRIGHPMAMLRDPHLEAMRVHAKLGGWSIEPHEMEFHEKIGQGTTADIYRGTWRGLDVAVKWIYPRYFQANESGQTWFAQELDTLSRQRHPFVLRLMGACFQPPQNGWVVTELLSGKTLSEWLYGHKERRRASSIPLPSLQDRVGKGLEIAQAMQYLHEQKPKIIHRDLKPSNILLDGLTHVRVADFGHARFLPDGEQALTGEMGTYVYMAPEVIRSEPYDEKCDVYSFGIMLNELITGQHPYSENSFGPSKIALLVAEGRLRPKLPEDDCQNKELIDLISCSWDEDAPRRPSFAKITSSLRKIQDKLRKYDRSNF